MKGKIAASLVLLFALAAPVLAGAEEAREPRFRFSFSERIRQESSDNVASLDESVADSSSYVRFKTSLTGQWRPSARFEALLKLTNENRLYLAPKSDPRLQKNWDLHEIFVDQLFLKWKEVARLPLTVTLGRQDMAFGEGFVIQDGAALDGSRSFYFNALRLDYALRKESVLTFFYVYQPQEDNLLPVINNWHQKMGEQDEQGVGFYYRSPLKKGVLEAYLLRKDAHASDLLPHLGYFALGSRVSYPVHPRLNLIAEAAMQWGRSGDEAHRAWGGYGRLEYQTGARLPLPTQLTLGTIYLSGDDPATGANEGWDPSFSRWPKWSESFIYFLAKESRPAYWSNWVSLHGGMLFALADKVTLVATLHRLWAAQQTGASSLHSGLGLNRGILWVSKVGYEMSAHLAGHFIWEAFLPGSYYLESANVYHWVRFEISARW